MAAWKKTARTTEGVNPATAAKHTQSSRPRAAEPRRRRPNSAPANPARKVTCSPDTATTWASPVRRRAVYTSPGRRDLSPVTREMKKGARSGPKQRRRLSFRAPAHTRGR